MEDELDSVGTRIKELRKEMGLSIQDVSDMTGLTASLISQIENGRANPSLSSLFLIARALNVRPRTLIEADDRVVSSPVVRKKDRERLSNASSSLQFIFGNPSMNVDDLIITYAVSHPGSNSEDFPEINAADYNGNEFFYVLSGKIRVELENEVYILNEGDSISFDNSSYHNVSNQFTKDAELIWIMYRPKEN